MSLLVFSLGLSGCALAQFAKLDEVGEHIAKKLKPLNPKMVAVTDFTAPNGSAITQGEYFARLLTVSIKFHSKKKVHIADHVSFDSALATRALPRPDLSSPESFRDLAAILKVDTLVMGTFGKTDTAYVLQITMFRAADGAILHTERTSLRRSEFLDNLTEPFPRTADQTVSRAGVAGIGTPSCLRCPMPSYTDDARRSKIQGVALFDVLISAEGRPLQIHPVKLLGYGIDEQAYNVLKEWQFKPATDKEGHPVAVLCEIEVSFRLY